MPMNKINKIYLIALLGVLLIGAVVIGIIRARKIEEDKLKALNRDPKVFVIVLTDKGFEPQNLTIAKGQGIRWLNRQTSGKASVNSDPFPKNTDHPELNLGQFAIGQSLVHVFDDVGEFKYHDHFQPKFTGTIEVK